MYWLRCCLSYKPHEAVFLEAFISFDYRSKLFFRRLSTVLTASSMFTSLLIRTFLLSFGFHPRSVLVWAASSFCLFPSPLRHRRMRRFHHLSEVLCRGDLASKPQHQMELFFNCTKTIHPFLCCLYLFFNLIHIF